MPDMSADMSGKPGAARGRLGDRAVTLAREAAGTNGSLPDRVARLYLGLAAFGVSLALMVQARLGLSPWDVLNQGVARVLGIGFGWAVIAVGALVLLAWIPLRQRPGFGTVSNVVLVGLAANAALALLPAPGPIAARAGFLAGGIGLNALATALYIGARLGPGPRDGLMTGLAARGHSIRVVRTGIEISVLLAGIALGGSVGVGTLAYALTIGPAVHLLLPVLTVPASPAGTTSTRSASTTAT
jgi:uncharacterized membrane protein YczE